MQLAAIQDNDYAPKRRLLHAQDANHRLYHVGLNPFALSNLRSVASRAYRENIVLIHMHDYVLKLLNCEYYFIFLISFL